MTLETRLKDQAPGRLLHGLQLAQLQENFLSILEFLSGVLLKVLVVFTQHRTTSINFCKIKIQYKNLRWNISIKADKSSVRVLDYSQEKKIINKINAVKKSGDTLGGTFITIATGVPVGLGSFMQFDRKLDADIAFHIMSINAVKGVEIGSGFNSAEQLGSQVHDEIKMNKNNFSRTTNNAGGIEGGISNGLPIIIRAAMKPISTLAKPLNTIDLSLMKKVSSRYERSDFTAVPSCAVIAESMLAWVIAKHFLIKFGGDSIEETTDNFNSFTKKSMNRISRNFKR